MNRKEEVKQKKLLHIELIRIIAILGVMFNHTGVNGYLLYTVTDSVVKKWIYMFFSVSCKVAVPLFFMISGALLLGKKESIKDVLIKRILKFVIVLFVFSVVYEIFFEKVLGWEHLGIRDFFVKMYSSQIAAPLWYLYAYIGMMLMLPVLRKFVRAMKNTDYLYMAIMSIVFTGIIPIAEYLMFQGKISMNNNLEGGIFTSLYIVVFMMGYYFEYVMPEEALNYKVIIIGGVCSFVSILISCYMNFYSAGIVGELTSVNSEYFHMSLIVIPCYTIYLAVKMYFKKVDVKNRDKQIICWIGSTVFGIYLLEGILRILLEPIFIFSRTYIRTLPACFVWILSCLVVGVIIVSALKKIPIVNRIF